LHVNRIGRKEAVILKRGIVSDIFIYTERKTDGKRVKHATCVKDHGILGDVYAKGGERQITLRSKGLKDWLKMQHEKGLCFDKFKENITIADMYFSQLTPDTEIQIGEALLRISGFQKECYGEACKFFKNDVTCSIPEGCRFAMVVEEGTIKVGDAVVIVTKG